MLTRSTSLSQTQGTAPSSTPDNHVKTGESLGKLTPTSAKKLTHFNPLPHSMRDLSISECIRHITPDSPHKNMIKMADKK